MEYYEGLSENIITAFEKKCAIPKPVLKLIEKFEKKYKGVSWPSTSFKNLNELCSKHEISINDALDAISARNSLRENEEKLEQNEATFKGVEEFLIDFLTHNLSIEVNEESCGFNGRSLEIKLSLKNKVISEGYYTLKEDEG